MRHDTGGVRPEADRAPCRPARAARRRLANSTVARRRLATVTAALLMLVALPSCEFVGPTAPPASLLEISANPLAIGLNGEVSTVTVIVSQDDGNPPPNGTIVFLTSTLGTIAPQVNLSNGRAAAQLVSGAQGGVAVVTALSGNNTSASIDIVLGSTLAQLSVSATPTTLSSSGGEAEIKAVALDEGGEPLAGIPVTFTTTAGSLTSAGSVLRTNSKGEAVDHLTTTGAATVTATSGEVTGSVEIVLADPNAPPTASFTISPTSVAVGQPVFFNGAASSDEDGSIVSYKWDFGDGNSGSGRQVSHQYGAPGSYVILLTVTDDAGGTGSSSKTLTVTVS